mgnify:FL=1
MRAKHVFFTIGAILLGVGAAVATFPAPGMRAQSGVVTADCGQVQPTALGIHFSVLPAPEVPSGDISTQSTGGPISSGTAVSIASQNAVVRAQLPAPLTKTQYVLYSNDNRGTGTSSNVDGDAAADANPSTQGVKAWIVSFCGIVDYASRPRGTENQGPARVRNEWNVVVNAYTGQVVEEYSQR